MNDPIKKYSVKEYLQRQPTEALEQMLYFCLKVNTKEDFTNMIPELLGILCAREEDGLWHISPYIHDELARYERSKNENSALSLEQYH